MNVTIKKIPNFLTTLRIFFIPILVLVMYFFINGKFGRYVAAGIFIFASITDYLDGKIARAYKVQTNYGRMLDPIADKMLVASTLLMMSYHKMAPVLPIVTILCREIFVSGMREFLADIKVKMPVSNMGKVKTALQMISISIILLGNEGLGFNYADLVGKFFLYLTAILTVISGYMYFKLCMRHL